MKILITSGLSERDIGGPFQYGPRLRDEFQTMGHDVRFISYGRAEKLLPIGLRHAYFFSRILPSVWWSDWVLTLDTFSVGVPSVLAAKFLNKKSLVRIGGDFLWESYAERTGRKITLRQFNDSTPKLNIKEKIILYFTKILIKSADTLVFNTEWQRRIWQKTYGIPDIRSYVVINYIPPKNPDVAEARDKRFLWAGRQIKLKNLDLLREIGKIVERDVPGFKLEIIFDISHLELQNKIRDCYAVVLPSFSDVCPNFILEAISFGKPFIMTDETGLKEIYNEGGIFIDPFDKDALKEAILKMLDIDKYQRYKKKVASLQLSRSWRMVAREFLSICQ